MSMTGRPAGRSYERQKKPAYMPVLIVGVILSITGCSGQAAAPVEPTLDPESPEGRGEVLFQANCAACHALQDGVILSGPPLEHIGKVAEFRIPGMSGEEYLRESIVDPNAYSIKGFETGLMRQDFATAFTSQDVDDLVAYLMTLQ